MTTSRPLNSNHLHWKYLSDSAPATIVVLDASTYADRIHHGGDQATRGVDTSYRWSSSWILCLGFRQMPKVYNQKDSESDLAWNKYDILSQQTKDLLLLLDGRLLVVLADLTRCQKPMIWLHFQLSIKVFPMDVHSLFENGTLPSVIPIPITVSTICSVRIRLTFFSFSIRRTQMLD